MSPARDEARQPPARTDQIVYTPPYPARPLQPASAFKLLRTARKNLIAIWPDNTFELESFSYTIFKRRVHIVSSPDAVKQVFVDGGAKYERKTSQQRHALAPLIGDGLFISDGETWRQRRKVVAPVTHISRLPELAPAIAAGAAELRAAWLARAGQETDVLSDMAELTAGIICAAIFGRQLARPATRRLVKAFSVYQALIGQIDLVSFLGLPDLVPRFHGLRSRLAARRIHRVLDALVTDILDDKGTTEASLIRSMRDAAEAGDAPAMDRRAFRDEAAVLFMAGHETTANTLAWAWFLLSQDPASERRLHAEVDHVLGDAPAGFADYEKLPFTRAVIEETLRLYPPVPLQGRVATGDGMIGGKVVKSGDLVILNAWLMHRHRKLWPDPDVFSPDRFLPGGSGIPSRYAYVPFSIGPRICTGAAFGLLEAVLCLATLARRVRLGLRPGHVVEPSCRLSLRPGDVLPMLIQPRG
jgi:cytochrome P450